MRARSAPIQPLERAAVIAVPQHRPRREQLVQAQGAMENVAADEPEGPLQIERTHNLPPEHRGLEIRRMSIDKIDHDIGNFLAMCVPRRVVRQNWRHMLAEQTGHMPSWGC